MKKLLSLLMIIVMAFQLSACTKDNTKDTETVNLYFIQKDKNTLTYEEFTMDKKIDKAETVRHTLNALFKGPEKKENVAVVRGGTKLLSARVDENGNAIIDLSKEFYNENGIYDILAASSIVKTVCSIKGINGVYISVCDSPLVSPSGEEIGLIREDDLVFDITEEKQNEVSVKLYFSDKEAMYFVKENRKINVPTGESVEKMIVSELIKGPTKDKAMKTIPSETKIRSVETKDGVCFVNLSSEFITKQNGGSATEYMTIFSIVNSLTELSHIYKVQFLVEGEKKDTLMHFTLNEPFERDMSMVR